MYCDETTYQVLKEDGRRPQATSYLWAQMTDSVVPIRCFTYTPGRGTKLGDKLFTGSCLPRSRGLKSGSRIGDSDCGNDTVRACSTPSTR